MAIGAMPPCRSAGGGVVSSVKVGRTPYRIGLRMWGPWLAPGSPESHLARVRTRERRNHDDAGAKPAGTADPRRPKKQSDEDPRVTLLMLGDPSPWFTAPTPSNPE